ncbi:LytR C-terminal domain-containing protein [Microbacteriaceae bacterium VKM Ac-2855]|nr:LytR C-terminal domain-containing protein [Microbacteriaceae bacterium VKM Ac-2855]
MASSYPQDRFDDRSTLPDRVGSHRRPPRPNQGWITFAWAALVTGLIVGLGVIGLLVINNRVAFNDVFTAPTGIADTTAAATPTPTVVATIDPSIDVAVLNGTAQSGLAATAGDSLTAAGWTVPTVANADTESVTSTTVYYADPTLEGAALGLAQALGTSTIAVTQDFVDVGGLVVVLGADYVSP